eukprot:XP_001708214.1 Hypothetical protein GL50803_8941 [Giardia lamblia ATCC 50803]
MKKNLETNADVRLEIHGIVYYRDHTTMTVYYHETPVTGMQVKVTLPRK